MYLDSIVMEKMEVLCNQYGIAWVYCPCGVALDNGVERFVLKFRKGKSIIKIYHEDHGRSGKKVDMRYTYSELDNETLMRYYHVQDFPGTELKQVLAYIYNHGKTRRLLDQKRNIILRAIW